MKTHSSCTTPAGSQTCGLVVHLEALGPDPRCRPLIYTAWTRTPRHSKLPMHFCMGRRGRFWKRRWPIYRLRLGRRRHRRCLGGIVSVRRAARRWSVAFHGCMLIQCPQHPYWASLGRRVHCLMDCYCVQFQMLFAVRRQEQAQAYGTQQDLRRAGAGNMMSEAEAARSRSIDSSDIEGEDGERPERRTPHGTPLPAGPPPPQNAL